jgi:hypothetical protein
MGKLKAEEEKLGKKSGNGKVEMGKLKVEMTTSR